MRTLLNALGFLSLLSGIGFALYVVLANLGSFGNPTLGYLVGTAYFVSGLAGYAVFAGIAEILERLERIEGVKEGSRRFDDRNPNPPGWNDPK